MRQSESDLADARADVERATTPAAVKRATRRVTFLVKLRDHLRYVEREYKLTEEEWRELYRSQGGACAVCKRPFKTRLPAVDHNHLTGEVRGLLCGGSLDPKTCNRLIDWFTIETFERIPAYLRNPPARAVLARMRAIAANERLDRASDAIEAGVDPVDALAELRDVSVPAHVFRSLNGASRCVAIVGPLNSGQACGLSADAHGSGETS